MARFTTISTACSAVALAGLVTLSAQTPQTPTPQTPTSPAQTARADAPEVTIVGCLKRADQVAGRSAATGSTAPSTMGATSGSDSEYVLTDASMTGGGHMGTTGQSSPSSTAGTMAGHDKDKKYRLEAGSTTVNLAAHLNHKVEIKGSLDKSSKGTASGMSSATGTPSSTSGASTDDKGPKVRVSSLRMISETCS
jgi:hypothetical protein